MPWFLLVFIGVYSLVNLYVILWFWRILRGSWLIRPALCLAMLALAASFPCLYWSSGASAGEVVLLRLGSVWAGSLCYLLLLALPDELLRLLVRLLRGPGGRQTPRPRYAACFGSLGLVILVAAAGWLNAAVPALRKETISIHSGQPHEPITIAALSDIHLGRIITCDRLTRALNLLQDSRPDAIFFLGDTLDDHILLDREAIAASIARFQPPLGIWGIAGNHEYFSGEIAESLEILEQSHIRVLRDEWVALEDLLLLVGRDDYSRARITGSHRKSLEEILADVPPAYRHLPVLVLDHQPHRLEEAEKAGVALQISGHTHNAQLWPFNLILGFLYENPLGWSQRGATRYYVSVGTGTWGPPLRNTARPEVLLLRIEFEPAKGM